MSQHWWFVSIAWSLAALLFAALALGAALRHTAAQRRLARLDPRREARS